MPNILERQEEVLGFELKIVSFILGGRYYARVQSVQRNTELSRAEGSTQEAAEQQALEIAKQRLAYQVDRQ